ncbi:hypothetical protein Scep_024125 [Stephania cephalantha]|uniref:Uncharacterized protein n=1 Tax=Stephania cephalantha TaxID=152367 RepID=A0AAP0HY55_9MAGN
MAETVARNSGSRADDGRRDPARTRGARDGRAATRRGGALTTTTVGGSTGEGLASLQHDRAMADAALAGGRAANQQRGRRLAVWRRAIEGLTQGRS